MKLLRCEIYNFGKFHGYKHEFDEKFDQIFLPNGEGKTTLVSFIICVFFGPKDETAQNLLRKYSPLFFQGPYGGEIEFINNGVEYKLIHTFSKFGNNIKFKSEKLELLDKNNYSPKNSFENDCPIAYLLSKVRKTTSSLLNTVIFSQEDMKNNKGDDNSLNNLFLNQLNDLYGLEEYDDVRKALNSKKTIYGKNKGDSYGKKAKDNLDNIERKINDETNEKDLWKKTLIEECGEDFESSLNLEIKKIDEKISEYERASTEIKNKMSKASSFSTYRNEKKRLEENEEALKSMEEEIVFNPSDLSDAVLQEFREESDQLSNYKEQIAKLNIRRDSIQLDVIYEDAASDKDEIENLHDSYLKDMQFKIYENENRSNANSTKNLKYSKISLVCSVVLLILAIVGVVLMTTGFLLAGSSLLAIGAVGFIISICLFFFFRRKNGVDQKTENYSNYNLQGGTSNFYSESEVKLRNIFSKYQLNFQNLNDDYITFNNNLKNYQKNSSQKKELTQQIDDLEAKYLSKRNQFESKLKKYGYSDYNRYNSYDDFINKLQSWFIRYKALKDNIDAGKNEISKTIYEGFDQINEDEMDSNKLTALLTEIEKNKDELNDKRRNISNHYDKYCETLCKLDSLKQDRNDAESEIEKIEKYCELYQKGLVYLEKAKTKIISSSFEPFKKELRKFLSKEKEKLFEYTEIEQKNGTVRIIFNVQGKDNITSDYLSKGYQDYYKLAVRFSFLNMIYKDEKPFIILDDPFVNMDKDRLETVKKVVLDISKDYQIIYLCCHESRKFID